MFEDEFDGVSVDDFHSFDDVVIGSIERLFLGVDDAPIVPPHRFGVEIGAIVEFHPFVQVKHIDLAVLDDLLRFGEVRDNIQLGIDSDQTVEKAPCHIPGLEARGDMGIEPGAIRFVRHP
jgi:hypothetical protein